LQYLKFFSQPLLILLCLFTATHLSYAQEEEESSDTTKYEPNTRPTFSPSFRFGDPFSNRATRSPLFLKDPSSLEIEIDTGLNYTIYEKIGNTEFRPLSSMSFQEFNRFQSDKIIKDGWKNRSQALDGESAVSGRRLIPKIYFNPVFDRVFGGSYIDIQPNGFINLDFGGRWQRINNPAIPIRQQRNGGFDFNQQISMNVVGNVGEKLAINANFDNNNTFDFQNNMRVEYTGYEEDIIKKIEIGNVSLPISNSLINGGQSLFGVKTQLQFGDLFVSAIASRQQGRTEVINLESGFQGSEFEVRGSNYDENRHFFLSHFFRDNYENWLSNLPQISSGISINRVEVYVLNRINDTQTLRNFVAFTDLGESRVLLRPDNPNVIPVTGVASSNNANELYSNLRNTAGIRDIDQIDNILENQFGFERTQDYVKITSARKLEERDYTINRELGYITLLRRLQNDEVLAVAYEYSFNGNRFKVGELTEDVQSLGLQDNQPLFLKMLRPNRIDTELPTWDLMMKNIYNLNANQVEKDGFQLRIIYRDDLTGIDNPSLQEGPSDVIDRPLLELFELDNLNQNNDPQPDGNFDYVEGVTIQPANGNIIFPVLEPFGSTLREKLEPDQDAINRFVFDTLYRTTRNEAEQQSDVNKFFIKGEYQAGSASEIVLPGINISEGSVTVTAGNTPLIEGTDFRVDYNLGRVTILNQGVLSSGKEIQVSYEKADLFNFRSRWLTGLRLDYELSDDINFGATLLRLNERPGGISRFSIGDEPTRNTKYGFDVNFRKNSRAITNAIDAIPLIRTKEESSVNFSGEFAQLIPGTSNQIQGQGTSFIDDFENAITPINLGGNPLAWKLAATPETDDNQFDLRPPGDSTNNFLPYAYRRAKTAWYIIDNSVFYRTAGGLRPDNLTETDLENHYVRAVLPQEIFRQQDRQLVNINIPVFNVAYFPSERGQYNYNPDIQPEGRLPEPPENYGGITRAITTQTDFDNANIQYIEFWLMDPFIQGPRGQIIDGEFNSNNTTGGELVFNLGNISEDLMLDSRHAFENGLPRDGSLEDVTQNVWGRVTNQQYLNDNFDNLDFRSNQDVGLDGLTDELEVENFSEMFDPAVFSTISEDPSGDNFQYFLGDELDSRDAKIIERYKNFNGMDNNSPVSGNNQFTPQSTQVPDNEDLNNDNTISDVEQYHEYRIPLEPGQFEVGQNNIVDQVTDASGEANWYLFRIPIRSENRRIHNGINGFKNIRFIRMYLTEFQQPVVLRMAKFQFVGSQWRRYEQALREPGLSEIPENPTSNFDISVVNIEENGVPAEGKVPYVVPPGLNRDRDNTTPIQRRNNEQSLQLCISDLEDGDSRAVFKNVSFDLIRYGKMKMFFHAESFDGDDVRDGETTAFIRLGTDFVDNYYEVEVPLTITPKNLTLQDANLQRLVWPEENEIDIDLGDLSGLKALRNRQDANPLIPFTRETDDGRHKITVKGNPDIRTVMTIMIGARNPSSPDRENKSLCIWANELRVTDFDTEKGWAANARISTKLADFATINASGRIVTSGFGTIQQRISERTTETARSFDVSANINVDKLLLPEKTGLKIPMFVSYEKSVSTPRFDPKNPDIELDDAVDAFNEEESGSGDDFKRKVEDRTTRRSINFTNVRKEKVNPEAKNHVYDIENFSFTYAFSESKRTNFNTAEATQRTIRGGLSYNYSPVDLTIEPFKNVELFDSPYLTLLKDFNINPLPSNFGFRGDLNRSFQKTVYNTERDGRLVADTVNANFIKTFTLNRSYNLRWALTRSLTLDYSARANAIVDEPEEIVRDEEGNFVRFITKEERRDSIMDNLKRLGRMKNFNQNLNVNYKLPLDKFPVTDWLGADLNYSSSYTWTAGSLGEIEVTDSLPGGGVETRSVSQIELLGNIIQNTRQRGVTGKVDLVGLYNKVPFLKEANTPQRKSRRPSKEDTTRTSASGFGKGLFRFLMSVRNLNFTYSINESTTLPGFKPRAFLFGLDSGLNAPGLGFVFGSQDPDVRFRAARNGWLAMGENQTNQFSQTFSENLSLRASVEPFDGLKIQLDAKRTNTARFNELFRFNEQEFEDNPSNTVNGFVSLTPIRSGSYDISYIAVKTAFDKNNDQNESTAFNQFEENIGTILNRIQTINPEFDTLSQDVLIPAFISAYSGADASSIPLTPFPKTPLPNWRLDFAGLSNLPGFSENISSINLTHSYVSNYRVNNYQNTGVFEENIDLSNNILNYTPVLNIDEESGGTLVPKYRITQVSISERFAPLIGINIRTKGGITTKIDYNRDRNLTLNLSNGQVTETKNSDVSFDFGYTKDNFRLPFRVQGRTVTLDNEISFRVAFTVRDSKSFQRKINDENILTNGNLNFQLRPTLNYVLNERLNLTLFFERTINEPRVSNSFRRGTTAFGGQLRFSLQ